MLFTPIKLQTLCVCVWEDFPQLWLSIISEERFNMIKNVIKIQCKGKEWLFFDLSTRTHILPMESALEVSCRGNARHFSWAQAEGLGWSDRGTKAQVKAELTYASLPELFLLPLLSNLVAGEWGLARMHACSGGDGGHGASRSQAGAISFSRVLSWPLLKDLDHGILLDYFGMEILYSAKIWMLCLQEWKKLSYGQVSTPGGSREVPRQMPCCSILPAFGYLDKTAPNSSSKDNHALQHRQHF